MADQELDLEVSEAAVDWLASEGYDPEFGARPLRRLVQRKVQDAFADLLIDDSLTAGDTVLVDYAQDKLVVRKKVDVPTPPAQSEHLPRYFDNYVEIDSRGLTHRSFCFGGSSPLCMPRMPTES